MNVPGAKGVGVGRTRWDRASQIGGLIHISIDLYHRLRVIPLLNNDFIPIIKVNIISKHKNTL
jgi:hypothetical protein